MRKPLAVSVLAVLAFVVVAVFIPADPLSEILSVGVLIAAIWGLVRWGSAAAKAFARGAGSVEQQGVIGIVLLLFSIIAQRIYASLYIYAGRPDEWTTLHISPFIIYMLLIALVLFISATKYRGERPMRMGGVTAALVAFVAVMLSTAGPWIAKFIAAGVRTLLRTL